MSARESSSQLERNAACAASAALPQTRSVTIWGERGRSLHGFLERARTEGREAALIDVPEEWRPLCEALDLSSLPKGTWDAEVALAYDVDTGAVRELGRGADRDTAYADLSDTEIPGTLDAVGISVSEVFVPDWKTGYKPIPPPERNKQLRFNALLAARRYDRHGAVVELVRIREDGSVRRQRAELDALELLKVEDDVRAVHARVVEARAAYAAGGEDLLEPVEGPWCEYCPAFNHCPAKKALALQMTRASIEYADQVMGELTDEMCTKAWGAMKNAKKVLAHIEKRLRDRAYGRPFYIGDNTWLGRVEKEGNEQLDGQIAWAVVAERRGQKVADQVVEHVMTKKAVEQAVRLTLDKEAGEKISKARDELFAEMRRRGGVTRKKSDTVDEYSGPPPVRELEAGEAGDAGEDVEGFPEPEMEGGQP